MTHREIGYGSSARSIAFAGGLAVVVLLVGCGASDDATGEEGGPATSSSSFVSPLEEYLSPSSTGNGNAEYEAKEKKVQEIVAGCMADQGFDYVPFVYPMPSSPAMDDLDFASRAWAEKYGYGISTTNSAMPGSAESVADPNQAIVDAMSDSQREAYYTALWGGGSYFDPGLTSSAAAASTADAVPGTSPSPSSEAGATPQDSTGADSTGADSAALSVPEESIAEMPTMSMADQGCTGKAQAEVYGDTDAQHQEFQPMWDAYNNLFSQLENDDRIKAAEKAWVDCMAGAGHPGFKAVWDASQQANDRWAELNGWPTSTDGGDVAQSTAMEPVTPAPDKVAEFKAYEIDIALDDWDCKQSSEYTKVSDEIRIALEEQFIEEHRAELERYRDAMNGGG
jgi:hypothetical protein